MPGAKARLRLDGADPINRGLLGFWPTDEASGSIVRDISPFASNGIITNGAGRVFDTRGRSVSYNGSTQYWGSTHNQGIQNGFSASAWINLGAGVGANQAILSSMHQFDLTILWQISSGTTMQFWADTRVNNSSSSAFSDVRGKVVHVGVSWAPDRTTRFFLNGVAIGSSSTAADVVSPIAGWNIGRYGVPAARYFTGRIGQVRTWGRVLQPREFMRLYADPWAGTERPLSRVYSATPSVAVALTGQAATFSAGTIAPTSTVAASGQAATFATGTAAPSLTVPVVGQDATFAAGTVGVAGDVTVALTGQAATFATGTISADVATGDTHDGFVRRSRRQRALDAADRRRRDELAQEATALRLSLEAAMGMAAEVVDTAPVEAVEAVQTVAKRAARMVPDLADMAPEPALLAAARNLVEQVHAAVAEAERRRALAEDDEDVLMLLRAL